MPRLLLLFLLSLLPAAQAAAQPSATNPAADTAAVPVPPRHATLAGWHDAVDILLLDRTHSVGSVTFDRGLFRRLTPFMDSEYHLDVQTYGYTYQDDYAFYRSDGALRMTGGSISKATFMVDTRTRTLVPLAPRHRFLLRTRLQEDPTARRLFAELQYEVRLGARHYLGARETLGSYKPDFDLSFYYAYGDPQGTDGFARVDLTLRDYINNFVFSILENHQPGDIFDVDTVRVYDGRPLLWTARLHTPSWRGLRAEAYAGHQPERTATFSANSRTQNTFAIEEAAGYQALLVEYAHPWATVGVIGQRTTSRLTRSSPAGSRFTSDYATAQRQTWVRFFALGQWRRLYGDLWLARETYTDDQTGDDFDQASWPAPVAFEEHTLNVSARIRYLPPRAGVRIGLGYLRRDRDRTAAQDEGTFLHLFTRKRHARHNHRLTGTVGYQFAPDRFIDIGTSIDLDQDTEIVPGKPRGFDGAYIRLSALF